MKTITFIFIIMIMTLSLMSTIDANPRKYPSIDLFHERLLDLLLEAKRRELLHNKQEESEEEIQSHTTNLFDNQESNEDNYERTNVRRKVVGISDNPF